MRAMISLSTPLLAVLFLLGFVTLGTSLSMAPLCTSSNKIAATTLSSSKNDTTKEYTSHLRAKIAHSVAKGERRAGERAVQRRQVCTCCLRPDALCVCDALPPNKIDTKTQILILQHPNERRKKNFSTVPLLRLVLRNVQVLVGYQFENANEIPAIKECLDCGRKPLLLYPTPDAIAVDECNSLDHHTDPATDYGNRNVLESTNNEKQGNLLIIVDGTWTEAKRTIRESPSLVQHCQTVQFTSVDTISIYDAVRKEPEAHCLSTLEACAKALDLLEYEDADRSHYLTKVLESHVKSHLANAKLNAPRSAGKSARKLYAKNKRRREIELELFQQAHVEKINNNFQNHAFIMVQDSVENSDVNGVLSEAPAVLEVPSDTAKVDNYDHKKLNDGAVMRLLSPEDAEVVNSWWEYKNENSLSLVRRRIELDKGTGACLGIELVDGSLAGCIVRFEKGALGMLHVHPEFRRKGYASALLQEATRILKELGKERVAFIVDGNQASEAVFAGSGWRREDPTIKRRTGKRRAKRKWIHTL